MVPCQVKTAPCNFNFWRPVTFATLCGFGLSVTLSGNKATAIDTVLLLSNIHILLPKLISIWTQTCFIQSASQHDTNFMACPLK